MFKMSFCLFFLTIIVQLSGCSSVQPTVSSDSMRENNSAIIPSPTPEKSPKSIADENFEKDWKENYQAMITEVEQNRRKWQENKIINYDFVIDKTAGGNTNEWNRMPVLIKIRENKQISIELFDKENDYIIFAKLDGFEEFDTIDKLFDYMHRKIDEGKIVNAEYDEETGYPKFVTITLQYRTNHNYNNIRISKFEKVS